jgi:hypothetical protein
MWRGDAQGAHDPYALYTNSNAIGVRKDVETGGTLNQSLFPTTTELLNKWSHVTGVYDSSLNIAKVYIDGNLVQQKTFSTSAINYSTLGFWNNIGAAQNNMGFFKGSIDEVRIYDKVLSENEIQKLATSN